MSDTLSTHPAAVQARTMGAISDFAARTAHDFSNFLTIIRGFAEFFRMQRGTNDSELNDCFQEIILAVDRANVMLEQLLVVGRRRGTDVEVLNVHDQVRRLSPALQQALGSSVTLTLELADEPLFAKLDPKGLEWILSNLALAARDGMPQGGVLTVRTARLDTAEPFCAVYPNRSPGEGVLRLSVHDTGPRLEPAVLERVFEPFVARTRAGRGHSGLELAMAYGLAVLYEGLIHVETSEAGTTFHVYVPCVASPSEAGAPHA